MNVGFGQILIIIILLVLLFGDVPSLVKKVVSGIKYAKQSLQDEAPKEIEQKEDPIESAPPKKRRF